MSKPVLDPAAQSFADATAGPSFLCGMPPQEGRKAMRDVQQPQILVPGTTSQEIAGLTVYRPEDADSALPVVLYLHGDWVFGGEHAERGRGLPRQGAGNHGQERSIVRPPAVRPPGGSA